MCLTARCALNREGIPEGAILRVLGPQVGHPDGTLVSASASRLRGGEVPYPDNSAVNVSANIVNGCASEAPEWVDAVRMG